MRIQRVKLTVRQMMAVPIVVALWLVSPRVGEWLLDVQPHPILQTGDLVTVQWDYRIDGSTVLSKGTKCVVVQDSVRSHDDRWIIDRVVSVRVTGSGEIKSLMRMALKP